MKTTLLCTGGIGSGKSFVVEIFRALGVPSYDCDSRACSLYDADAELLYSVNEAVGGGVVKDGRLDKRALASVIFSDRSALEAVENLVHPALIRDFEKWKASQDPDLVIMESAVLLEKPLFASLPDRVLTVSAPEELRISRAMARDSASREEILRRMANQAPESFRLSRSDYVVYNDGRKALLPQIMEILNKLKEYGKNRS